MLSRKEHKKAGSKLPEEWIERVTELLSSLYESHCIKNDKKFEVYGNIYNDELLVIISIICNKNDTLPISCFLSIDIDSKKDPSKTLDHLLDMSGIIIDSIFNQEDWNDYESNWTEHTENKVKFFYKISREDVGLTIQANQLLDQ